MTLEQLTKIISILAPQALVEVDDVGEIVIYTGLSEVDGKLQDLISEEDLIEDS
jgi:hypothetical protein